jgi:hypothetical protein
MGSPDTFLEDLDRLKKELIIFGKKNNTKNGEKILKNILKK